MENIICIKATKITASLWQLRPQLQDDKTVYKVLYVCKSVV